MYCQACRACLLGTNGKGEVMCERFPVRQPFCLTCLKDSKTGFQCLNHSLIRYLWGRCWQVFSLYRQTLGLDSVVLFCSSTAGKSAALGPDAEAGQVMRAEKSAFILKPAWASAQSHCGYPMAGQGRTPDFRLSGVVKIIFQYTWAVKIIRYGRVAG